MRLDVSVDSSRAVIKLGLTSKVIESAGVTGLKTVATRVEKRFKETSPVDTGTYRSAWTWKRLGADVLIYNPVEYAADLVYGSPEMVKHLKAPPPGEAGLQYIDVERGIHHDIRRLLTEEWGDIVDDVEEVIKTAVKGVVG